MTRCLEIISEAAADCPRHCAPGTRNCHGAKSWEVGNIYRHDYDNVAEEFVWRTVRHSLAPLLAVVEAEIASLSGRDVLGYPPGLIRGQNGYYSASALHFSGPALRTDRLETNLKR